MKKLLLPLTACFFLLACGDDEKSADTKKANPMGDFTNKMAQKGVKNKQALIDKQKKTEQQLSQ